MTAVNNSQISTRDNLIISSATGLLGGAGFALGGYYSKPYLQDGMPSDEFVKNVEKAVISKQKNSDAQRIYLNYLNNVVEGIKKSKTFDELSETNIKFHRRLYPENYIVVMKELMASSIGQIAEKRGIDVSDQLIDVAQVKNIPNLKQAIKSYLELRFKTSDFDTIRQKLGRSYLNDIEELLNLPQGYSMRDVVDTLYDMTGQRFVSDSSGDIPKDLFNTVEKTAKNIQWKTAGLWGSLAAALIGGSMFLIQKFSPPKNSGAKNVQKS